MYTDTDSFIYFIKTDDVYKDMLHPCMTNEFDFSAYSSKPIQFSEVQGFEEIRNKNQKVLGKMKDELGDFPMDEFVAHRSKAYGYTVQIPITSKPLDGTTYYKTIGKRHIYQKLAVKGVKDIIRKKKLSFSHYKKLMK